MSTAAAQRRLEALPEPVYSELGGVVRVLLGMDEAEKANAHHLLTSVAAFWAAHGRVIDSPAVDLVVALTGLVRATEDAASPTRKETA